MFMKKLKRTNCSFFFIYYIGDCMELIAHRGNNGYKFRENSIEAFIDCFNTEYIDGVEMDVRLTLDGKVVVHHDNFVNGKIISNSNLLSLSDIYKLSDILDCLSNKKKIIIDIKGDDDLIVDLLYDVVRNYNYDFYFCSFNYKIISLFKEKYFFYKCGIVIGYLFNFNKLYSSFDFVSIQYNLVNKVSGYSNVFFWTINDKFSFDKVKMFNNSFIITDRAYLVKNY